MSLPPAVSRYLFNRDQAHRRAICLAVGADYIIEDAWGDLGALPRVPKAGEDARSIVTALHGLPLDEASVMEFVGLSGAGTYDIHVFAEGSEQYVLLLPSDEAEARTIELQQIANEVRLLNEKQRRMVKELEEARIDLEEKRRQADHASAIKSRFIASMSHEFRTPLTSVIGYTELLLSEKGLDDSTNSHASAIRRSAHHLLSMVDNILDQARIDEGNVAIRMAPFNVRQLTDDITAMMAPLAAEKFLAFGAFVGNSVPEWVHTDEVRLRQILVNLVGNAIKFTDTGEVQLELSWADDRLSMVISDTGPGIEPDQQERVFHAFHRVGGNDAKRGTGLGLNITARLVELLNGTVSLSSEPGKGSEFSVTVEAPRSEEIVAGERPFGVGRSLPESLPDTARVMVAEDDPDLIELLSLFLKRGGYELVLASDGQQAINKALAEQPDIVLMDVNMPVLDGLSAVRELRNQGFTKPVIALTASLSANDRDQAFAWGCDGYLVKPISMPELLSTVDRQLKAGKR